MSTTTLNAAELSRADGLFKRLGHEFLVLLRLARAVHNGDYDLATPQVVAILGAIGYVISPVDAIPDVVPLVGLTDDAGVVAALMVTLSVEILAFRQWEAELHGGRYR